MSETPYIFGRGAPVQPVEPVVIGARQTIQARPEAFGAGVAQGEREAGAALGQAGGQVTALGKKYEQIASDDAYNQLVPKIDGILHGVPGQTGPDGQPDAGYLGMRGRDAVIQRMDQAIKETRDALPTPEAQLEFDKQSQRYRTYAIEKIGTNYERQRGAYEENVNRAAINTTMNSIAVNAGDDTHFRNSLEDARHVAAERAKINGGDETTIKSAVDGATADSWETRIKAIGVKDPGRAMEMADQHKDELGVHYHDGVAVSVYDQLVTHLRARADEQIGNAAGQEEINRARVGSAHANPAQPVYAQAAQSSAGFSSPRSIARTVQIESGGNPNAGAGSGHVGAGQFSPSTARAVGITDRGDFTQSVYGIQRYAAMNRPILEKALGREPTDAELYLAHQQGPAGASKLLANPEARAGDLVGDAAIRGNGGDPNAPASAFTAKWTAKFNGTPFISAGPSIATFKPSAPATPGSLNGEVPAEQPTPQPETPQEDIVPHYTEQVKADAYRAILDNPNLNEAQKGHAERTIQRELAAEDIAFNQTERARKEKNDAAAQEIVAAAMQGQFQGLTNQIATDNRLNWQTKMHLGSFVQAEAKRKATGDDEGYGQGYADIYRRVVAAPGDPQRIADASEIYRMAGDGGPLTGNGAQKLVSIMREIKKPESASAHAVFSEMMREIKKEVSFEVNDGFVKIPDPVGERNFAYSIFPALQTQFDKALAEGGDLQKFYQTLPETARDMRDQLRPPAQMARDKLAALGQAREAPPPPPAGVQEQDWGKVVTKPPLGFSQGRWGQILSTLVANPTEENVALFNKHFGARGARPGADILRDFGIARP